MASRTSPFSTYKTYLYHGATQVIDIKDFTEPLAPREQLDTTTIIDDARTYRAGIRETNKVQFTCNYLKSEFQRLTNDYVGKDYSYSIKFGDNGDDGIFTFSAIMSLSLKSGGVNDVVEMIITLSPTSEVTFS